MTKKNTAAPTPEAKPSIKILSRGLNDFEKITRAEVTSEAQLVEEFIAFATGGLKNQFTSFEGLCVRNSGCIYGLAAILRAQVCLGANFGPIQIAKMIESAKARGGVLAEIFAEDDGSNFLIYINPGFVPPLSPAAMEVIELLLAPSPFAEPTKWEEKILSGSTQLGNLDRYGLNRIDVKKGGETIAAICWIPSDNQDLGPSNVGAPGYKFFELITKTA